MEGCYLLLGEDTWSKNKYIEKIKQEVLIPGNEMMNFFEAKDKEVTVSSIQDAIDTLPFFAEQKLIYLKDTELFKVGKKDESEKFEKLLNQIPSYVVLLIDEKEADKRGKLYKSIKNHHHIIEFNYPGEEVVYAHLKELAEKEQIKIDEATLRYLIRNMPEDMAYILEEWQKLISYVGQETITKKAIENICVFSLETRVFEMVKKIVGHEADEALQIYRRMIQSKESPIGILVLIARQFRMMYQVKYLLAQRASQKEIAAKTKLPFFAVKEMTGQVQNYTFNQLEVLLEACLKADEAIKTGKMESTQCVEVLIMTCLINC